MKRCPNCGKHYPVGEAAFCISDGAALVRVDDAEGAGSLVGKTLGGYRIREPIGRGGFGEVYAVENISLGRVEALKILSPSGVEDMSAADRLAYERWLREDFVRETRALVSLDRADCPYIARIFDSGVIPAAEAGHERDLPYFTMEYVEGGSLRDLIRREERIEVDRALNLLRQIAEAVRVAHEVPLPVGGGEISRGIIHRDLKLENVMLSRKSGAERAKVVDFGVARVMGEGASERTRSFGMVMTLGCAAPEQMMGDATPSVDLFALGVLAYELLTGHEPWKGRSLRTEGRVSQEESVERIMRAERLKVVRPDRFRPDIPPELKAAIFRLLRKDPADRFPTARALEETLSSGMGSGHAAGPGRGSIEVHSWTPTPFRGRRIPYEGISVTLLRDKQVVAEGKTPFRAEDLPSGRYRITTAGAFRHAATSRIAEVKPQEATAVDLEVERTWTQAIRNSIWKWGIILVIFLIGAALECGA